MAYLFLMCAIVFEVIATTALKASAEFTRLVPSLITIVGYTLAFYCLSLSLRGIPIGIAYAVWSGIGMVLIALVQVFYFRQPLDLPAMAGMALILSGVCVMNLFSKSFSH